MPLYGHELDEGINPLEAGLGWAVKLDKGDFIGRTKLQKAATGKTRIGLELEGKRAAREGCGILAADQPIGTVTSGSFVPFLEKSIAMGYVSVPHSKVGTNLSIDIRGSQVPAKVVDLPFYQRAKKT
jgi:aminomethyltransferase